MCKTYRSLLPGTHPIDILAYTRLPKDCKKPQILEFARAEWNTSCYTGTLSAAVTSNWSPFPCTGVPQLKNVVGDNSNMLYCILDSHTSVTISEAYLLLLWTTCNTDWVTLHCWALKTGKKMAINPIKTQSSTASSEKHSLFFTNGILWFSVSTFWKVYKDFRAGLQSTWSARFCNETTADAWGSFVSVISCLDEHASQPSVTAPGMHGTDYKPEQVTGLSNKAGVNPQPLIISLGCWHTQKLGCVGPWVRTPTFLL